MKPRCNVPYVITIGDQTWTRPNSCTYRLGHRTKSHSFEGLAAALRFIREFYEPSSGSWFEEHIIQENEEP